VSVHKMWNLSSPKMCRDFLKNVRFGPEGSSITYLQQADGNQVSIDDATDEQVLQIAAELAEAFESVRQ
jgi:hypothetical protein